MFVGAMICGGKRTWFLKGCVRLLSGSLVGMENARIVSGEHRRQMV